MSLSAPTSNEEIFARKAALDRRYEGVPDLKPTPEQIAAAGDNLIAKMELAYALGLERKRLMEASEQAQQP